jgi:replication factor C small subunit
MMNYASFSERMRPRKFEELILPDETIQKFNNMVKTKSIMNMTFYGSAGTGKTTCAKLLGQSANYDLMYINASMTNGIDDIRNKVHDYAVSQSVYGDKKIVLLDESDFLSKSAQASLRGLIETSINNCRFILTANDLSKIQDPIQSRCRPISFNISYHSMSQAIKRITKTIMSRLDEIDVSVDEAIVKKIIHLNYPDYRSIANEIEFLTI